MTTRQPSPWLDNLSGDIGNFQRRRLQFNELFTSGVMVSDKFMLQTQSLAHFNIPTQALSALAETIPFIGTLVGLISSAIGGSLYQYRYEKASRKMGGLPGIQYMLRLENERLSWLKAEETTLSESIAHLGDSPRDKARKQLCVSEYQVELMQQENRVAKLYEYKSMIENDLLWAKATFVTLGLSVLATLIAPGIGTAVVPEISKFCSWLLPNSISLFNAAVTAQCYHEDTVREVPRDRNIAALFIGSPSLAPYSPENEEEKRRELKDAIDRAHRHDGSRDQAIMEAKIDYNKRKITRLYERRVKLLEITTQSDKSMYHGKRWMAIATLFVILGTGLSFTGAGAIVGWVFITLGVCMRFYGSYVKTYRARAAARAARLKEGREYEAYLRTLERQHPGSLKNCKMREESERQSLESRLRLFPPASAGARRPTAAARGRTLAAAG